MPSHKELVQKRFNEAESARRQGLEELDRLDGQRRAERKAIDQLEADYNAAALRLARGEDAETSSILSQRDRHNHKLRGLDTLYNAAAERFKPIHDEHQVAARELQAELDREEIERLQSVIDAAESERDKQQAALNVAAQNVGNAKRALYDFRHKLELRDKQEGLLQQRRA